MAEADYDLIVIGAGAAGLMCAIEAGARGRRVLLLEHNDAPGKKIRISGGGRCNFTNLHSAPVNFLSDNPHFCISALARFTPADFVRLVERHGISYHEKTAGQLFCDGSAAEIVGMLLGECARAKVEIRLSAVVTGIRKEKRFAVEIPGGELSAPALVIATGGLSIPRLGATGFGYRIAQRFGHAIVEPHPGLVPFLWAEPERRLFGNLGGVSLDVSIATETTAFRDSMLFTHRGLSGPAVLQLSSAWRAGQSVTIDFLPDQPVRELIEKNRASSLPFPALLAPFMPRRLADRLCTLHGLADPPNRIPSREIPRIEKLLHRWILTPAGTAGFEKAEVTVGGVDTREISSRTMESRRVPGLYFIGELLDVTGWLGGHNFQWAWASGWAAGREAGGN